LGAIVQLVYTEFTGYRLTQSIEVHSEDVNKVTGVSRQITELSDQGVQVNLSRADKLRKESKYRETRTGETSIRFQGMAVSL